ncbi:hypothetical protein UA08_01516 [Talaromyces atroroseus]|uniref:LEA domain protein n=1 Tax=Talaromyces atroroseus TaxID=1441469 RepID=A0A1Q5QBS2_TALAT|nr:hypothetical protein UA08_01516 [Talaromyces atroroseus]OKL63385.1 hypothetical protein UA08_01516 [Talaromyces atroroseus]
MVFATRVVPRRAIITPTSFQAYRPFSTTLAAQRGPVEATKDVLKKADKTVSGAAVKGIETGEKITKKAQETIGAKGKEAEGKAKGKASEVEGKVKGKAEELRSEQ